MGYMRLGKPNNLLQTQLTITWGNTRIEVNLCLVFPGGEDCQAHGFVDEPRRSYNQEVQDRGVPLLSRRFCTGPYFLNPYQRFSCRMAQPTTRLEKTTKTTNGEI